MKTYRSLRRAELLMYFSIAFLTILTVETAALSVSDTKIATSRNSNRADICAYYTASFTPEQRALSKANVQQYSYLSDSIVEQLLFRNTYDYSHPLTLLITLPHLFALVVLMFLLPFLLCCCAWPGICCLI
jgi:hypothetical protein